MTLFEQIREWLTTVVAVMAAAGVGWALKEVDRLSDISSEMTELRVSVAEQKAQYMITQERYKNVLEYTGRCNGRYSN